MAAQFTDDRELTELIGELSLKSPDFASLWAKHPVQRCTSGVKRFHHPEVGELDLHFDVLHLPDASGQRVITHTAEPGSLACVTLGLLTAAAECQGSGHSGARRTADTRATMARSSIGRLRRWGIRTRLLATPSAACTRVLAAGSSTSGRAARRSDTHSVRYSAASGGTCSGVPPEGSRSRRPGC